MGNYRIESIPFNNLDQAIRLPSYQRPLVWSKSQKQQFIENLSKGFPFGSLLLYRYQGDLEKYTLIDGQQRYTTIREYAKNPEEYFPVETLPFIDELMSITGASLQSEDARAEIRSKYIKTIKELLKERTHSGTIAPYWLFDHISKNIFPSISADTDAMRRLSDLQQEICNAADKYIDLDTLLLPCVIFTGAESDLPDVFANVNLGGRKLTKYQVFAAQWNRYEIDLLANASCSEEILEKTIERYEALTNARDGITIEDFSAKEMRDNRQVTLPEFCHALGMMIIEESPACWPKTALAQEDTVDTLGYNTFAIILGIKPQEIKQLPELFSNIGLEHNPSAIEEILLSILNEYRTINSQFSKYLRRPDGKLNSYETSRTSGQLQFLSYFAALWRLHYRRVETSTIFEVIPKYKQHGYEASCRNLFPSFLIDMLTNQWKGSGDSRLASYIDGTRSYTSSSSKESLDQAIKNWIDQEKDDPSINIDPVAKTLLTVFANGRFTQYGATSYDIEHLFSREVLRKKIDGEPVYKKFSIPGGSLGNILFLPESQNRSKGSLSLAANAYEEYSINRDRHLLPEEHDILDAENRLREGDPTPVKQLLLHRSYELGEAILRIFYS